MDDFEGALAGEISAQDAHSGGKYVSVKILGEGGHYPQVLVMFEEPPIPEIDDFDSRGRRHDMARKLLQSALDRFV